MISKANYLRQHQDECARLAGEAWDALQPQRDAETKAWEAECKAITEGASESEPSQFPPRPYHQTRTDCQQAAIEADRVDHGADWDATHGVELANARALTEAAEAAKLAALTAAKDSLDKASTVAGVKTAAAAAIAALEARLAALEGR